MGTLDVHAHLAPIVPHRLAGLAGVDWSGQAQRLTLDGHVIGVKDLFYPERLLDWMDGQGMDRAWVSIPPPLYRQHLPLEQARQWVDYVNRALPEVLAPYNPPANSPSAPRLQALCWLPLEHPAIVESILNDWDTGKYGNQYAGVALAAGGHADIVYSRNDWHFLWAFLQRHKSFVFIHPGTCADARLAPFYLENLLGNPYETAVAASHLVMAGIPQRYPDIRFCLAHAGGAFPCLCGRLERGFLTRRMGVPVDEVEPPLQAARRFYADSIAHGDAALRLAQDIFGKDHILYGSDWPFPMGVRG